MESTHRHYRHRSDAHAARDAAMAAGAERPSNGLALILSLWLAANFLPHVVVFAATGRMYFQLSGPAMLVAEGSIMLLNLALPVAVVMKRAESGAVRRALLGWVWTGPNVIWSALVAFLAVAAVLIATQKLVGDPLALPGRTLNTSAAIAALLLLIVITPAAEETMFRGWIQGSLERRYGAVVAVGLPALLFGLRHLPMDLYAGLSQNAPASAWSSRILQLSALAIILGVVRHRTGSAWSSWLVHMGLMLWIIGLSIAGAVAGP